MGSTAWAADAKPLFHQYCIHCHEGDSAAGNLDLSSAFSSKNINGPLIFENIATAKMPPATAEVPSNIERRRMMTWLAEQQPPSKRNAFRRLSRHEFVNSLNDLLGTNLDLTNTIPEDRGTRDFDSDRRILLSREMLSSYFSVADRMLEHALPVSGFVNEQIWVTNKLKDSHETYNIYQRGYKDGVLFSWTRANNGNSYSFFYDNFNPPAAGWYELTFDAAKIGDLQGDVSLQVHAGKYYYADDRPQPQRLLDVISLSGETVKSHKIRAFLRPGENVSVHCFNRHNFREKNPQRGAYLRKMTARGPLQDTWPPSRFSLLFGELQVETIGQPERQPGTKLPDATSITDAAGFKTNLEKIGGSLAVSSFQQGMEKEQMQDGSNRTFWHTRFTPTLAKPPHFVVLKNPHRHEIKGLLYATWSGGNGNGQVERYEVYASEDGKEWGEPIVRGSLETRLANEQFIEFPDKTSALFLKFVAVQSFSLDGRSLASIGKLDVLAASDEEVGRTNYSIPSNRAADLRQVVKRFAERAFCSELTTVEMQPYFEIARNSFAREGDFIEAAKAGFKAVICSPRFLMIPGEHSSDVLWQKAMLAHVLWLSIPDEDVRRSKASLREQISEMLQDDRSDRMIASLCRQWLNLRSWHNVAPSLKLYPRYDDLLDYYLPQETIAYVSHLIRDNRPVSELIDSDYSFLNQRLAQHYDIPDVTGQQLRKLTFAADVPRGGLLTMGSVLKVTTDGFATSPILRGAWISKNIVGTPVSPPPESVKAIEPEHGAESASLRAQIEQHKHNEACFACHKSIDPYGFALENFDATGKWRTEYTTEVPHRGTFQFRLSGYYQKTDMVDSVGEINDQKFDDIFGLKALLVSHDRKVAYNFAKKFFQYANGYEPTLKQRLALLTMTTGKECRMRDLVTDVLVYSLSGDSE